MADLPIAELRRLLEEATPGPWRVRSPYVVGPSGHGRDVAEVRGADADLIAAMRNALPALLDAAEERDRLREERGKRAALESAARELLEAVEDPASDQGVHRCTCVEDGYVPHSDGCDGYYEPRLVDAASRLHTTLGDDRE